jgi:hypothetical protein
MKRLILICPLLIFISCSIQKRKYQDGFYVDWGPKKGKHKTEILAQKAALKPSAGQTPVMQELTLKADASGMPAIKKRSSLLFVPPDTCDVLVFKDGAEISGKLIEITPAEVKYKRCDNPTGPVYVSRKSELFMIKYANGTREVIKVEEPPRQVQPRTTPQTATARQYKKVIPPGAPVSLVTGILSMVIGYVGLMVLLFTGDPSIFTPFAVIAGIFALIAVIAGRNASTRINENPEVYKGRGMAVPGIVFGFIVLGILALILLLFLVTI